VIENEAEVLRKKTSELEAENDSLKSSGEEQVLPAVKSNWQKKRLPWRKR